jgi:hypothetical protein
VAQEHPAFEIVDTITETQVSKEPWVPLIGVTPASPSTQFLKGISYRPTRQ